MLTFELISSSCSTEPGYYEDGSFGIRIENVVLVVQAKTKVAPLLLCLFTLFLLYNSGGSLCCCVVLPCLQYNYRNRGSLTFDPLTLVPIQVKLMKTELLTQKEVKFMMSPVPHYPSCFARGSQGQRVVVKVPTGGRCSSLVRCVPTDRLGKPVPQEVPGSGWSGA